MEEPRTVSNILAEFEEILSAEAIALRSLDRDAIDAAALRKLELDDELRSAVRTQSVEQQDRATLQRVRQRALANQLLLVHARSCLLGVLSMATGQSFENPYGSSRRVRSTPAPVRLDFRG